MHLVGYFHSCITMYGFMNVSLQLQVRWYCIWSIRACWHACRCTISYGWRRLEIRRHPLASVLCTWSVTIWKQARISETNIYIHNSGKFYHTVSNMSFNYKNSSSSSSCSGRIRFESCSLYPQNEIVPSISSSVVLCVFVLLVCHCNLIFVNLQLPVPVSARSKG